MNSFFAFAVVLLGMSTIGGCGSVPAPDTAAIERFQPCPDSPNCVSSLATTAQHAIDALPLPPEQPIARIAAVVLSLPRTAIVYQDDDYLHATFTSGVFRFVDDVEFRVDRAAAVLHVRSASRVGYSDLGVNRARVEQLRALLGEQP